MTVSCTESSPVSHRAPVRLPGDGGGGQQQLAGVCAAAPVPPQRGPQPPSRTGKRGAAMWGSAAVLGASPPPPGAAASGPGAARPVRNALCVEGNWLEPGNPPSGPGAGARVSGRSGPPDQTCPGVTATALPPALHSPESRPGSPPWGVGGRAYASQGATNQGLAPQPPVCSGIFLCGWACGTPSGQRPVPLYVTSVYFFILSFTISLSFTYTSLSFVLNVLLFCHFIFLFTLTFSIEM